MNYKKLKIALDEVLDGKHDAKFEEVIGSIHCMSRARVYAVINAVVSSMDPDEVYVEVGTYQGGSIISALLHNDASAIGVDSFGEFKDTNSMERTMENLLRFGVQARVGMLNMGYQKFFSEVDPRINIGAYYYDGEHNYEGQLAGMEAAWPYLHPGSIVMVDDLIYPEVSRAVNQFIANHVNNLKFTFVILPTESIDPVWWNGVCVLQVT